MASVLKFSRSGRSAFGGLLVAEVKTKVTAEVQADVRRAAAKAGVPVAEFVRELLMMSLYGCQSIETLEHERRKKIAGFGAGLGQEEALKKTHFRLIG